MSRLSPLIVTYRTALATVLCAFAWTATGCLAPAKVTSAGKDTIEPQKAKGSQLVPAKIVANEEPKGTSSPIYVEALPLPLESHQDVLGSKTNADEPAPAPEGFNEQLNLATNAPHWQPPRPTPTDHAPSAAPNELSRLPAAEDASPAPTQLVVNPQLGPPIEPFTPAELAPPPQFFSVAQGEPIPPPPATQFIPPAELLPAMPLPRQPSPAPGYFTQQPIGQPIPEQLQQPSGQLGTVQRIKSIQQISLNIAPPALVDDAGGSIPLPNNIASQTLPLLAEQQPFRRGEFVDDGFDWQPEPIGLEFCYQPLYFEEVNLERYGRSWGIFQPYVSAFHFYRQIHRLPYYMFSQPARRCTYHAHWALPGYRIPCREPRQLHPSVAGAMAESAWVYGMLVLVP